MEKKTDYLILLNHTHRLPEGFEDTITLLDVQNAAGEKYRVEEKAYAAFLRLREDLMKHDGLQIELLSVYRDIARQQRTWDRTMETKGEEYTRKYVAIPGCSEHHTGFALDVGFMLDGKVSHTNADLFSYEQMYRVVHRKMPAYGFILRYPAEKEAITKISYEPWHFRYIDDPALAQEITDRGICFEEFWEHFTDDYNITSEDVYAVYDQLKDKYPLVMTTAFTLNEGFTNDCPVLMGKAHGLVLELYEYGGLFILDIDDEAKTKGTHWHPDDVEAAVEAVAEFMEGKAKYELQAYRKP